MNIWNILQIAPTKDKKAIRRAYAAQSKIIHPEEKPEEFRILYEAYQKALEYTKEAGDPSLFSVPEESLPEEEAAIEETSEADTEDAQDDPLLDYFERQIEAREQLVQEFIRQWMAFARERRTPEQREWWAHYLSTEEFQSIKWHPQVIKLLVSELEQRFTFEKSFKILLWESYDFPKKEAEYEGDLKKLYQILHTEYEMEIMLEGLRIKQEQNKKAWRRRFLVAGILLLLLLPFWIYQRLTAEQRYAVSYLNRTYPMTAFSDPEKGEKIAGDREYHFQTPQNPEITITVRVSKDFEGDYCATDNYKSELLKYYAQMYEIPCGVEDETPTLYYEKTQDLTPFCQKVIQMFQEHKELKVLEEVGLCAEDLIYPEVMIGGGVYGFSYPEEQVYPVEELADETEAEELSQRLFDSYLFYLFNYEAWNLTEEQYLNWAPLYEQLCMDTDFDGGDWIELYMHGERVCGLYLPLYSTLEVSQIGEFQQTANVTMMTVGNAYHYLKSLGADITVNEDGSGFHVKRGGQIDIYGKGAGVSIKISQLKV